MISEAKTFVEAFFKAELKAKTLRLKSNIEEAEQAINFLYGFATEDCYNRFGAILPVSVKSKSFYEKYKGVQFTIPRHIFKISNYKNKKYENLYYVYVSSFLTDDDDKDYFRMTNCFLIALVKGQYKIVGEASMDPDNKSIWIYEYGDNAINFDSPGELVEIKRYLEPVHDHDNMAKYYKNE